MLEKRSIYRQARCCSRISLNLKYNINIIYNKSSSKQQQRKQDNCEYDYTLSSSVSIPPSKYWHAHSGCTKHMTDDRSMFTTFSGFTPGTWTIKFIDKKKLASICFRYWRCLNPVSSKWWLARRHDPRHSFCTRPRNDTVLRWES